MLYTMGMAPMSNTAPAAISSSNTVSPSAMAVFEVCLNTGTFLIDAFICCWLLFVVIYLVSSFRSFVVKFHQLISYIDTTCKSYLISFYEAICISSIFMSMLILSMTVSFSYDDFLDIQILSIIGLVGITLLVSITTLNIYLLYSISSNSNGEALKKVIVSDFINIVLCFVRVILCWTRYIFYDMQVEFVDVALQHTDEIFAYQTTNNSTSLALIVVYLDIFYFLLQIVLSLFKIAIASFLLWLILDLFLLKPISRTYSLLSKQHRG